MAGASPPIDIPVMASTPGFRHRIYALTYKSKEDATWLPDWIVIYAVLFVLAAAVAGRVPADN